MFSGGRATPTETDFTSGFTTRNWNDNSRVRLASRTFYKREASFTRPVVNVCNCAHEHWMPFFLISTRSKLLTGSGLLR